MDKRQLKENLRRYIKYNNSKHNKGYKSSAIRYLKALQDNNLAIIKDFKRFESESIRKTIENYKNFKVRKSKFGFTDAKMNEYGWLTQPDWLNVEEITFKSNAKDIGHNKVILGMSPKKIWANGIYFQMQNGGGGARGLSVHDTPFNSREEALFNGLKRLRDRHVATGNAYSNKIVSLIDKYETDRKQLELF